MQMYRCACDARLFPRQVAQNDISGTLASSLPYQYIFCIKSGMIPMPLQCICPSV